MDVKEAASLLRVSKETVADYVNKGISLKSGEKAFLRADKLPHGLDISEEDLDGFISALESDEPGRHPPVRVQRELLIEAGWKCAICLSDAPLEFHHILAWSTLKHHDPQHMLAVCPTCHGKITRYGQPDSTSQKEIKNRLATRARGAVESSAHRAVESPVPAESTQARDMISPTASAPLAEPVARTIAALAPDLNLPGVDPILSRSEAFGRSVA